MEETTYSPSKITLTREEIKLYSKLIDKYDKAKLFKICSLDEYLFILMESCHNKRTELTNIYNFCKNS